MSDMSEDAVKMLATALEIEEKGRKFYGKAIDECPDELGKEIFGMLRDDEVKHAERIKKIYSGLQQGDLWSEDWVTFKDEPEDMKSLFRRLAAKHGNQVKAGVSYLEALDIGIEFEAASVTFYQDQLKKSTNPLECEFIKRMVQEERGHHAILNDMRYYYSDPEGWMMEKGITGLDGA